MIELFDEPIFLADEKVRLVPLELHHLDQVSAFALNEDLWTFAAKPIKALNRDGIEHYIRNQMQERSVRHCYPFLIYDQAAGIPVGIVRYENISVRHQKLDLGGTLLSKEASGKGYMKSCAFLLLNYAFYELEAVRVGSLNDERNTDALAFLEAIGARNEGKLRYWQLDHEGNGRHFIVHSIIADEWDWVKTTYFSEFLKSVN